ncbi:MAG: LuxR C-terminal-related transcriptional regulator, partial [Spirochaetaceae bacterium]|nr:LuxR C-terminal-related transcriptional regulator [Spirochaetaceae bacterium]
KVGHWLKNDFDDNDINSAFHILELLVRAKYLFASGHYNDIFAIIARKEYKPGQGHFLIEVLEMTCLEAASRRRTGDRPGALRCLEKAWEAAASNALTMPFIEMGDDMRLLVSDAINGDNRVIPRDWLESIRSRASAYGKRLAAAAAPYRQDAENRDGGAAAVYLTRRERKILTLLSQGFTRDEIARETDRPEGSIKNSIHTIYHKLRALNRADAIRIATKMGLLP